MRDYRVRSVGLASAAKFGLALGVLASLLPACLCGLVAARAVAAARQLLEGATQARLSILGQSVPVNLVEIARLGPALESLRALDALGISLALAAGLAALALASAITAVTVVLVAAAYNALAALTGGLRLELQQEPRRPELPRGDRTPPVRQG